MFAPVSTQNPPLSLKARKTISYPLLQQPFEGHLVDWLRVGPVDLQGDVKLLGYLAWASIPSLIVAWSSVEVGSVVVFIGFQDGEFTLRLSTSFYLAIINMRDIRNPSKLNRTIQPSRLLLILACLLVKLASADTVLPESIVNVPESPATGSDESSSIWDKGLLDYFGHESSTAAILGHFAMLSIISWFHPRRIAYDAAERVIRNSNAESLSSAAPTAIGQSIIFFLVGAVGTTLIWGWPKDIGGWMFVAVSSAAAGGVAHFAVASLSRPEQLRKKRASL
jgi:hypothetical protein